jgi:hypothetical protein
MNEPNEETFDWQYTPVDDVNPLALVGEVTLTSQINRPPIRPTDEKTE